MIRKCSYCNKDVDIKHKHRLKNKNIFCNKICEASFRRKEPNIRCCVCKKPLAVKPSRLTRLKSDNITCSKTCDAQRKSSYCLGNNNSNYKHNSDYSAIYELTPEGCYILGLIYSDGSLYNNTITITQNSKYRSGLYNISKMLFNKDYIKKVNDNKFSLNLNSKELVDFIVSLGGIRVGKKDAIVDIPKLPEAGVWAFICGYFDGDGGFKYNYRYPEISISSNSSAMLASIANCWGVNYTGKGNKIYASGFKALDICGKMYESTFLRNIRKYEYYLDILNWQPLPGGKWLKDEFFKYKKLSPEALPPEKKRVTDSGYDVFAVSIEKDGATGLYIANTQIAIEPIPGYYFDLVGRSSLPKNGFHFVGGVGIIDRSYIGPIKMLLQKISDVAGSVKLPFKCGQLIPRPIIHAQFVEVDALSESGRGSCGFGSTGR